MFKDKAFQVKSAVDKRGRKVGKKKQKEDISKYYRLENEEVRHFRRRVHLSLVTMKQ